MIDSYIRQYGRRLFGLCMILCGDSFEAEDLYQETWLKVVKNISRYDPAKEFEPWLTKICVNTYRNTLRRIARSPMLHFRLTVILIYFEDMDIQSAANVLGIPPGTVKSRLNRARNVLKEGLSDETDLRF